MPVALDPERFVCVDVETTGRDPRRDRVVQVGVVDFHTRGEPRNLATWLVDPGVSIPAQATAVHKLRDADVCGAPGFAEVWQRHVLPRLVGRYVVGYNLLEYDLPLLRAEVERCGLRFALGDMAPIDVYPFVPPDPRWGARKLAAQAERYGLGLRNAHDAGADAEASGWLLLVMQQRKHAPATLAECYAAQETLRREIARPRQITLLPGDDD